MPTPKEYLNSGAKEPTLKTALDHLSRELDDLYPGSRLEVGFCRVDDYPGVPYSYYFIIAHTNQHLLGFIPRTTSRVIVTAALSFYGTHHHLRWLIASILDQRAESLSRVALQAYADSFGINTFDLVLTYLKTGP